jgi:hypothetical protein
MFRTEPGRTRTVGARKSEPFGEGRIPWRFWVGPVLIAGRHGGGLPHVGWTR